MRFLLDESADYPLAAVLRELGHDVTAIAHDYPGALRDRQVLEIANQENRILIANDRDLRACFSPATAAQGRFAFSFRG